MGTDIKISYSENYAIFARLTPLSVSFIMVSQAPELEFLFEVII